MPVRAPPHNSHRPVVIAGCSVQRPTNYPESPQPGRINQADARARLPRDATSSATTVWSIDSLRQGQVARALLFESHQQHFAVASKYVARVIEMPNLTPVPGVPSWHCGLAAWQNQPVPVIDPVRYFVPGKEKSNDVFTRAIVVSIASSHYLFAVEKVLNLCQLNTQSTLDDSDLAAHCAIGGVYPIGNDRLNNKSTTLIDAPEFLRQVHLLQVYN